MSLLVRRMTRKSRNVTSGYRRATSSSTALGRKEDAAVESASSPSTSNTSTATTYKKRTPPTHFLCLPLADKEHDRNAWCSSLARFRDLVQDNLPGSDRVQPGWVRPAGTMHLTLGVMALDEQALERAGSILGSAVKKAWSSVHIERTATEGDEDQGSGRGVLQPLSVSLQSLVSMQRPTTSVLFADPIDPSGRLQPFCEALKREFETAGLIEEEKRELKLHATVLNTIYGKGLHSSRRSRGPPHKFDPSLLLAVCGDMNWADVQIDKVVICKMGAVPVCDDNGEKVDERYLVIHEVSMP